MKKKFFWANLIGVAIITAICFVWLIIYYEDTIGKWLFASFTFSILYLYITQEIYKDILDREKDEKIAYYEMILKEMNEKADKK